MDPCELGQRELVKGKGTPGIHLGDSESKLQTFMLRQMRNRRGEASTWFGCCLLQQRPQMFSPCNQKHVSERTAELSLLSDRIDGAVKRKRNGAQIENVGKVQMPSP